ncbi:hypothetical protein, partial [Alteromonas sp. BZK5]|uniref:hypothetical protein n=1 Tax=Alteromonas sp. BZK5 TaxID=1904459 RepID=UPI0016534313
EGRLIKELLIYHYGFGPALVGALGVPSIASISKSTSLWNNFKGIRGGTIARITLEVVSGYAFGAILANHYLQETVEYSHLKAKFNQPEFWHDIERDLFAQQYKILLRKPTSDFLTCKLPNDRGHLTICKNHFLLALESLCIKYSEACGRELASTRHDLSLKIEKVAKQVKQDLSENGAVDPFFKFLRLDPNDGFYYSDMRGVQGKSVIIF